MNLIEGGRPRIGCIRRQPSAGNLLLSLEKGHPSTGKIAGSSRNKGSGTSGGPRRVQTVPPAVRTISIPSSRGVPAERQGRRPHRLRYA